MNQSISYQSESNLSVDDFIDLLIRSTLSERRPIHSRETMEGMLRHADLIITARHGSNLVGLARAITDYSYCTYLSDLAVDVNWQRKGIGRDLLRRTHELGGLHTSLILLAAPAAREYYPHLGMNQHDSCWIIRGVRPASENAR